MGLQRQGMVQKAAGVTALSLAIPAGQSARVRKLYYHPNATAAETIQVLIDRKLALHFAFPAVWYGLGDMHSAGYESIMSAIEAAGMFPTLPLESGQTLEVTGGAANSFMEVVYDLYDADDVKAGEPNGSKSDTYRLFQVVSNSGVRATAGDLELNQSDLNTAFPAFPGGEAVPSRTTMLLLAMFGSGWTKGTAAANGEYTTYLKMLKDREDIFDKALTGMTLLGDVTHVAATTVASTIAGRLASGVQYMSPRIIVFDPPMLFESGDELTPILTLARTGAGADFTAGELKLGLVFDVTRT